MCQQYLASIEGELQIVCDWQNNHESNNKQVLQPKSSILYSGIPSETTLVMLRFLSSPSWGRKYQCEHGDGKQSPQPQGIERASPPDLK